MKLAPIVGVSLRARERAIQRLGADPPVADWLDAVASILDGRATLLSRSMSRGDWAELYLVTLAGQPVQALWKPMAAVIVTVVDPATGPLRILEETGRGGGAWQSKWRNSRDRQPYVRARHKPQREDWR